MYEIYSSKVKDPRGSFLNVFRAHDSDNKEIWSSRDIAQINISSSSRVGSIRGLHMQAFPYSEAKMIRCINGRVWDVAVDLRRDSPTFLKWHGIELSSEKSNAVLIPEGCAHGFQVLEMDSELLYIHSKEWMPEFESGVRWDDPMLSIKWPLEVTQMSDRDANLPYL